MSTQDYLLFTPQSSAGSNSTEEKLERNHPIAAQVKVVKDVKRNLMDMDISTESLGILSLDDMKPTKDSATNIHISTTHVMEERRRVQESTRALLEKYAHWKNTSKNTSVSESTVNESDLKEATNMMTPGSGKGSTINESDLLNKSNISSSSSASLRNHLMPKLNKSQSSLNENSATESYSAYISNLKMQLETANSTATLSDIIGNMTRQSLELDSGLFQPGEDMKEQFEEDEKAWREKYASIPNASRVSFGEGNFSSQFDEKVSMGEFFRQKSEHCSIFQTSSPSKREPFALVNSTAVEDDDAGGLMTANVSILSAIDQSIASVLGVSAIQNIIAGEEDTPNKVIEKLIKAPLSNNSNNATKNNSRSQNEPKQTFAKVPSTPALLKDGYYNSRSSLGSPRPSLSSTMSKFSKYASSADLSTPTKDPMPPSSIYTARSLSSINDNDKENMNSQGVDNKSLTSCRSTSSMGSIPDDIAKLASTKDELVWGCVKEGRSADQDVTIRSKNNRRVKYQIQATNPNFKLNHTEFQGERGVIVLHPLETRKIVVTCAPNSIGPHTGNLIFTPIVRKEEQVGSRQLISMYAYSGHVNIQVKDHIRDPTGKLWFSLGCIDGRAELTAGFVIINTGSIDGFVSLTVHSRAHCAYDDISISPSKVVIKRGGEVSVHVRFRPSKNDLHLINAALGNKSMKTCEIAVIRMLSGADINRRRINKMCKKTPKDHRVNMLAHAQQLNAPFQNAQRGDDVRYFNESTKALTSMMQALDNTEISLLVDRDLDATLLPEIDDSTVLFKTILGPDESSLGDPADHSYLKSFNVEPSKVLLTPPGKCNDYFLLSSNYDRPVSFTIAVSPGGPLSVSPSCGEVHPGEICKIKVECDYRVKLPRQDFHVIFEIEDELLKAMVSVLNL